MDPITIYAKNPGGEWFATSIVPTPENIAKWIGGDDKGMKIASDILLIYNADGEKKGKHPFNLRFLGRDFYGPVIITGLTRKGNIKSVPIDFKTWVEII